MSEHKSSEFGTSMSVIVGVVLLIALVYAVTAGRFAAVTGGPGTPEEIAARIAPIGKVKLADAGGAAPAPVAGAPAPGPVAAPAPQATAAADEGPGAAIYGKACVACHATGAAGAPKLGDGPAWQPRIAQGMDQLMLTVLNGKGAMPPRGTCAVCSDDDLRAAVQYMVSKVM